MCVFEVVLICVFVAILDGVERSQKGMIMCW